MTSALLADIGGTNARFALHAPGLPGAVTELQVAAHATAEDAVAAALAVLAPGGAQGGAPPDVAVIALAAPVSGEAPVRLTNAPWVLDPAALRARFGFRRVRLVNDFEALAWALPHLGPGEAVRVGGGTPLPGAPLLVMGPGTGLGVAILVPGAGAVPTEGGHADLPATTAREDAVVARLRARLGRVSAEHVLSGPGLVNLHEAVVALAGAPPAGLDPAGVVQAALGGGDRLAAETLELFWGWLGTVAGNLALGAGARGGVFLAGGIPPRLVEHMDLGLLRARFEAKAPMDGWMRAVPLHVVTHPRPAFLGLAALAAA